VLYTFTGKSDGGYPLGGVVLKGKTLYGTTSAGGTVSAGTVFQLAYKAVKGKGSWTESTLEEFDNNYFGGGPQAGVILDKEGNLYGTADSGGTGGAGVVVETTP
jgi:uncharacterized repeat protein (TIGR03803 family)